MSTIFGNDPENEAAIRRNYAAAPAATVDTDGWLLQPVVGLASGTGQALGNWSASINYSLAGAWQTGAALTGSETASDIAESLREAGESSLSFIADRKRDAARSGLAAQLVSGLSAPLLSAAPLAVTGPTGFALGAGTSVGIGVQAELAAEGVDPTTAVKAGLLSAAVNTLGFRIPAGFWSTGYARTAAGGAAANIAVGQAELYGLHEMLMDKGYTEAAKQYEPLNPLNAGIDGALGAVFGAFHVRFNSGLLRARQEVRLDAMSREAVPGLPKTAEAVDESTRAADVATEQLIRGEPVDVSVDPVNFADEMPLPRHTEVAFESVVREETGLTLETLDPDVPVLRAAESSVAAIQRLPVEARDTMPRGTLYHGSSQQGMTVAAVGGEANLVGPGAYLSESPDYSSTYAGKTGELYVANPPDVELFPFTGTIEAAKARKMLEDLGAEVEIIKDKIGRKQRVGGDTLYGAAVDRLGSKAAVNAWLKKQGYGGIAFTDRATQVRNRAYFDPVPLRRLDEVTTETRAKAMGVEPARAAPAERTELSLVDKVEEAAAQRQKLSPESQAKMDKLDEVLRRNPAALVDGEDAAVPLKAMMSDFREILNEADHADELFAALAQCTLGI